MLGMCVRQHRLHANLYHRPTLYKLTQDGVREACHLWRLSCGFDLQDCDVEAAVPMPAPEGSRWTEFSSSVMCCSLDWSIWTTALYKGTALYNELKRPSWGYSREYILKERPRDLPIFSPVRTFLHHPIWHTISQSLCLSGVAGVYPGGHHLHGPVPLVIPIRNSSDNLRYLVQLHVPTSPHFHRQTCDLLSGLSCHHNHNSCRPQQCKDPLAFP